MTRAVAITRTELNAVGLRRAAGRERDAAASRRMLALALVLEGQSRTDAARATGMDRQTLLVELCFFGHGLSGWS